MSVMEVDLHKLKINDPFLGQYQQLVRDVVIPYQWDVLEKGLQGLVKNGTYKQLIEKWNFPDSVALF